MSHWWRDQVGAVAITCKVTRMATLVFKVASTPFVFALVVVFVPATRGTRTHGRVPVNAPRIEWGRKTRHERGETRVMEICMRGFVAVMTPGPLRFLDGSLEMKVVAMVVVVVRQRTKSLVLRAEDRLVHTLSKAKP